VHVTTSGVVTTGASAQGKSSGTLYWKIPDSISGNYRYQCQSHVGMVGTITIKNFGSI
jgi:plastocyanin